MERAKGVGELETNDVGAVGIWGKKMGIRGKETMKVIPGGNQMSLIRDTEEVIKFLEFAGRKAILNEQAINCRLTACHNLFSVLNEEEDSIEYILKNLDLLVNRFRNKNENVQASTLKVYKSRVKSSIEDFKAWSADPFAWERAITDKAKAAGMSSRKERKASREAKERPAEPNAPMAPIAIIPQAAPSPAAPMAPPATSEVAMSAGVRRVSFPIRPGLNVEMTLPVEGLTLKELQRLGLFLYPYCMDIDQDRSPWAQLAR